MLYYLLSTTLCASCCCPPDSCGCCLQILLQFDVNDGMKVPYMNNGHRCAAADASALHNMQQIRGICAKGKRLNLHNAKHKSERPVPHTGRRSLEVIMRKLLQLPGRPALVYVHWWSPTSNQGSASFWNRTVQPGALLDAE